VQIHKRDREDFGRAAHLEIECVCLRLENDGDGEFKREAWEQMVPMLYPEYASN